MSLTHEQKTEAPAFSWWRTFRFPLIVLAIFGGIFAIPWICLALQIEIEEFIYFRMATQWHAPALAVLIIAVWWLFFSGVRWGVRLGVIIVAVLVVAAFFSIVRQGELTMGRIALVPRFQFIWETSAEDKLERDRESESRQANDLPTIDATIGAEDFPRYRGPKLDGIVSFAKLQTDWQKHPPMLQWRRACPGGYGGVAAAGNIAVTLQQRGTHEVVVCFDRATGRERWTYAYDAFHKDIMGNGPRSTPTIHNQRIFTIGATGQLVCLNAIGEKQWTVNILRDAKAKNTKWGLTGSPLIVDDLVVAHAGIDPDAPADSALIAYEQATGKIRWRTGNRRAGYSSPQLAVIGNVPQILLFDGEGLVSYDKTGKELWQHPWVTDWDMNSIQPLVLENDRVFISSELSNGCAMLRVKAPDNDKASWSVEPLWQNKNLATRYANPVTDGKSIFGLHTDRGLLRCLDASNGKILWKGERFGAGQMLLADGVLLVVNGDTGEVSLFAADGQACNEWAQPVFEKKDKTWNTPALAGDQLFVRNQREIACLKLPRR